MRSPALAVSMIPSAVCPTITAERNQLCPEMLALPPCFSVESRSILEAVTAGKIHRATPRPTRPEAQSQGLSNPRQRRQHGGYCRELTGVPPACTKKRNCSRPDRQPRPASGSLRASAIGFCPCRRREPKAEQFPAGDREPARAGGWRCCRSDQQHQRHRAQHDYKQGARVASTAARWVSTLAEICCPFLSGYSSPSARQSLSGPDRPAPPRSGLQLPITFSQRRLRLATAGVLPLLASSSTASVVTRFSVAGQWENGTMTASLR